MVGGLQKHKVPLTPPSYGLLFVFLKATLHTHRLIIVGPQPFHSVACLRLSTTQMKALPPEGRQHIVDIVHRNENDKRQRGGSGQAVPAGRF